MKNENNDSAKASGRSRGLFRGKWRLSRWLSGPRLIVISTSLSVILILIVIGAVWLATANANNSSSGSTAKSSAGYGGGVNEARTGQGVYMPPVSATTVTTVVPMTTTTAALAPTPAAPPDIKAGLSDSQTSYNGPDYTGSYSIETAQREVIYNASISLTVNTISSSINQVQTIAQSAGGLVESMSSGGGQDQQQATITIRVPQDQFFTVMNKLQDLGTVQNQNISSQDVTQQFIDLQARLKSAQLEEQSLQSLLDKAQSISDIISIQTQLTQVRSQIESLQGQINYIQDRVDMSTITVNLSIAAKNIGQPPSASLSVAVSNVDSSLASVKQMVSSVNGIIDADSISLNNGKESAYLSVRVPRSSFAQTLSAIEREGKVQQKTVQEAINSTANQPQQSNIPPDAVITLSLTEASGFWTGANIAVVAIAGGVVIVALLVFLGLAWRTGLLRRRTE